MKRGEVIYNIIWVHFEILVNICLLFEVFIECFFFFWGGGGRWGGGAPKVMNRSYLMVYVGRV